MAYRSKPCPTIELPMAVRWETLRASYFDSLGPFYSDRALECRQLADHFCRRLQEEA